MSYTQYPQYFDMDPNKKLCACKYHNEIKTLRCDPENPYLSIRKLVKLMEDSISADFIERQTIILNDFLYACSCAFWVRDLPYIIRFVELVIEDPMKMSVFRKQFEVILKVSAIPPMLVCASEILTYKKNIEEYFTFLGCLLARLEETNYRDLILKSIQSFLHKKTSRGICCITLDMCHAAVEASRLVEIIAQLAEIADEDLYTKLLRLLLHMAKISPTICHKMIQAGSLDFVMLRMHPSWKEYSDGAPVCPSATCPIRNFEHSVKLLDRLLDSIRLHPGDFKRNNMRTPTLASLRSVQYALRIKCQSKGSELDRNTLLIILLKCLSEFPDLQYVQSELVDDLALLSIATESDDGDSWVHKLQFTNSNEDYQFKKMLLFVLCHLVQNYSSRKVLQNRKVMYYLLQIITPEIECIWLPQQHCKIAILTLHSLQVVVPNLLEDFIECTGINSFLMMMDIYASEPYNKELLLAGLKTIYFTITLNKKILYALYTTSSSDTFLALIGQTLSQNFLTLLDQQCLCFCFCILQILYKQFPQPCQTATIYLCITYMTKVLGKSSEEPLHDSRVIICGLDFLSECLQSNAENRKLFLSLRGVYLLLDIIHKRSYPVKLVGLRVLVDLCEESTCIPYLVTWRANRQNFTSMLMRIFREENRKLHVQSTKDGIISDLEIPLMGVQQWYETYNSKKDPGTCPAAVDLLASCRPKIYALLQLLNVHHKEQASIANDHYRLDTYLLSIEDRITLLLAENFLALKLGEVWTEMAQDFETTKFMPIAIDEQLILALTQRFCKWALYIQEAQLDLLHKEKQKEYVEERLLYHELNESRLDLALDASQQLDYLARTTECMFRWSRKTVQNRQIDELLQFTAQNAHRTFLHKTAVTCLFGQTVSIHSNKIINPHEEKFDLKPVSPCLSEIDAPVYLSSPEYSETETSLSGK